MKSRFGEVETPPFLVKELIGLIGEVGRERWLEVGGGKGGITKPLLAYSRTGAVQPSLTTVEIQEDNCKLLGKLPGLTVLNEDFLHASNLGTFDLVIGNPPFNSHGLKKVPTNTKCTKSQEGKTVWPDFVKKAVNLLKPTGKLVFLTPCIWLKPDRAGVHKLLTTHSKLKIRCFSASETVRLFNGLAQTPMVMFSYQQSSTTSLSIYSETSGEYIPHTRLSPSHPIPMKNIEAINRMVSEVKKTSAVPVLKSKNMRNLSLLEPVESPVCRYPTIKTAVLSGKDYKLVIEWSPVKPAYFGVPKLIMAHKMYGLPFLDAEGKYGIARRDIYVVVSNDIEYLARCKKLFSSKAAFAAYEATRYRMRFLEKYAFQLIPMSENINLEQFARYSFVRKIDEHESTE